MSSIEVAVRVRPFNPRELKYNSKLIINMQGQNTAVKQCRQGKILENDAPRKFTFDHSFWTHTPPDPESPTGSPARPASPGGNAFAPQETVYQQLGCGVLENCIEGYNSCLFAYGQTGSGKTYTMMGVPSDPGIIPRLCKDLFSRIQKGTEDMSTCKVECSYLEIYNENVRDLMNPSGVDKVLRVRQHPKLGVFVENLTKLDVKTESEVQQLLTEGNQIRSVAATNMNAHSSRSHAILTLHLRVNHAAQGETYSQLNLVDLAGSERASSTGATGDTLTEGSNINKSLTTLGMCLSRLAETAEGKKGSGPVPFRDSQLTWLLNDSLGGNSKTAMLANISPADINFEETMSTLRFAETTKKIKQNAVINEDPQQKIIRELRDEIDLVKVQMKQFEEGNVTQIAGKSKAEWLQQLVDSTELFQEMTESDEEKQQKQKFLKQQRQKGLAKLKTDNRIPLDSNIPRLHTLNEDLSRYPEVALLYYIQGGKNVLGSGDHCSIKLKVKQTADGSVIHKNHCTIDCDHLQRSVIIDPCTDVALDEDPEVYVNGELVTNPKILHHMDRIIVGPLAFRHAQPPAWHSQDQCEFSRDCKTTEHVTMLEEFDRLESIVSEFAEISETIGETAAMKCRPDIQQNRSDLNIVETKLIMDYPIQEQTNMEQALQFDYRYAFKEKDQVRMGETMKKEAAQKDSQIAALLDELDFEEGGNKEFDEKHNNPEEDENADMDDLEALLGTKQAGDDEDILGVLDELDDEVSQKKAKAEGGRGGQSFVELKASTIDGNTTTTSTTQRPPKPKRVDPTALVSSASSQDTKSLKQQLAKELSEFEDEVSESQKWKPNGPSVAEHKKEYHEVAVKSGGIPLSLLLQGKIDHKGNMYKLRIKKSMFHRSGFHPVFTVLRGNFLYYFDNDSPNSNSLGSCYLYGATVQGYMPPQEDKNWIIQIVPTVPRKQNKQKSLITEENTLTLGFDTEPDMVDWLKRLEGASKPLLTDSLKRFFGEDGAPGATSTGKTFSLAASGAAGTKSLNRPRRQTTIKDEEAVVYNAADKNTVQDFALQEKAMKDVPLVAEAPPPAPISLGVNADAEDHLEKLHNQDDIISLGDKTFDDVSGDEKHEVKMELYQFKIPLKKVPNHQFLKAYFRTSLEPEEPKKMNRKNRMWLVDHFNASIEFLDLTHKVARIYTARQLLLLEKSIDHPNLLKLSFFHHGFHSYDEYFLSFEDRERFYETAMAIRPSVRMYCPNLVLGDSSDYVDSTTPIEGAGPESVVLDHGGPEGAKLTLDGNCLLRVSRELFEPISIWTGTLNLTGLPLQNADQLKKWIPTDRYDLYAITVQEASYRRTQNQFYDFISKVLGKDYLTVASMDLYDVLLVIMARKRHVLKISCVEGSTCPTSIESLSGERGGVGISLKYQATSFCFVAVHLPGQAPRQDLRRYIIHEILSGLKLGSKYADLSVQFDHLFMMGDFSFPMDKNATVQVLQDMLAANESVTAQTTALAAYVKKNDSFTVEREKKRVLHGFSEPAISFPPTSCLEVGTNKYNVAKQNCPSYPGRIVLKSISPENISCMSYHGVREVTIAEHFPVAATFLVKCMRPVACCFMPSYSPSGEAANALTFESITVHKSLDAQQPCLSVSSDLFPPILCEEGCNYVASSSAQGGGNAYQWDSTTATKVPLMTTLVSLVPEHIDQCGIMLIVYDKAEKDLIKQHRGSGVVRLKGEFFDNQRKGKLQEASAMLQKSGRNVTSVTVKFRWAPI